MNQHSSSAASSAESPASTPIIITPSMMFGAAHEYADLNLRSFPCRGCVEDTGIHNLPSHADDLPPPTKYKCTCKKGRDCSDAGKHPWTLHGVNDATTDRKQINKWLAKFKRGANLAIAGGNGLLIIDVDLYKPGAAGELQKLEDQYGALDRSWTERSGAGGLHIFLSLPDGIEIKSVQGDKWGHPGIDLRSSGGYVIAAPSLHLSGRRYEWISRSGDRPPMALESLLTILPRYIPPVKPARRSTRKKTSTRPSDSSKKMAGIYREAREDGVNLSGWSKEANRYILDCIDQSVVKEKDTHTQRRLHLVRRWKAHGELKGLDGEALLKPYRRWFDLSFENMAEEHQNWETSISQFIRIWVKCNTDINQEKVYMAHKKALQLPLPVCALKYQSSKMRELARTCRVLASDYHEEKRPGVFYLSARKGQELVGIAKDVVAEWFNDFCRDKLLVKVCHHCWKEGTIKVEKLDDGRTQRTCLSCGKELEMTIAQRYRWIGDDITTTETAQEKPAA